MKFRKKPVVIEAIQFRSSEMDSRFNAEVASGVVEYHDEHGEMVMLIKTLEGEMCARHGDWIIRGIKGELYPCKPDIFVATYEAVE